MKNIGVIGSGKVGEVLANGMLKHGYAVMRGSREPGKLGDWKAKAGDHASTGTMAEAANRTCERRSPKGETSAEGREN